MQTRSEPSGIALGVFLVMFLATFIYVNMIFDCDDMRLDRVGVPFNLTGRCQIPDDVDDVWS